MPLELPPLPDDCERFLLTIPARRREDARQEAYLAQLEGKNPLKRIQNFCKREARYERHHVTHTDLGADSDAIQGGAG